MNEKRENIIISEKDIFCFVFYPETLSDGKRKKISEDSSLSEFISFYMNMKLDLNTEPDIEIKKKLASRIPAYTLSNVIELYPLKSPQSHKHKSNRLAAASTELKPQTATKTFVDTEKEYIVKVLNYGDTTKVFVFSTKDEVVKDFNIIIEPQNLEFHFDDNSEPLIIDQAVDAEKIHLRFQ